MPLLPQGPHRAAGPHKLTETSEITPCIRMKNGEPFRRLPSCVPFPKTAIQVVGIHHIATLGLRRA
jgi:hypothetical protein